MKSADSQLLANLGIKKTAENVLKFPLICLLWENPEGEFFSNLLVFKFSYFINLLLFHIRNKMKEQKFYKILSLSTLFSYKILWQN